LLLFERFVGAAQAAKPESKPESKPNGKGKAAAEVSCRLAPEPISHQPTRT
jgi:hypothetical protein